MIYEASTRVDLRVKTAPRFLRVTLQFGALAEYNFFFLWGKGGGSYTMLRPGTHTGDFVARFWSMTESHGRIPLVD